MKILQENFAVLQCCGLWPSRHWKCRNWKIRVYWFYSVFALGAIHWFTLPAVINLFLIVENVEVFCDNCSIVLSMVAVCGKAVTMLCKRADILEILTKLENYPYKPMSNEEEMIQRQFNRQIRYFTLFYGGFFEVTVWSQTIIILFQKIPFGILPYKTWKYYDYSTITMYRLTSFFQLFSTVLGASINVGCDTAIRGFLVQICAKFNILKCRLMRAVSEMESGEINEKHLVDCVQFHCAIIKLSKKINSIFTGIIFFQFAASLGVICVTIFVLSKVPLFSTRFVSFFMYFLCILLQIFMLCFSGNEATTEVIP